LNRKTITEERYLTHLNKNIKRKHIGQIKLSTALHQAMSSPPPKKTQRKKREFCCAGRKHVPIYLQWTALDSVIKGQSSSLSSRFYLLISSYIYLKENSAYFPRDEYTTGNQQSLKGCR